MARTPSLSTLRRVPVSDKDIPSIPESKIVLSGFNLKQGVDPFLTTVIEEYTRKLYLKLTFYLGKGEDPVEVDLEPTVSQPLFMSLGREQVFGCTS